MRLLIRTIVLASCLAFTIQPSAKAEVASVTYWQNLPSAIQEHNIKLWNDTVLWNETVHQNEMAALAKAAAQKAKPKTTQPKPKVESGQVTQSSGDRFDRLAMCESTMNQNADDGSGHYSYFQWLPSTYHSAGGVGDPRTASYSDQKVAAQRLAQIANPATQWPHCWPASAN